MRNIYASYIRTAYVQRQLEHKIQGLMSRVAHLERVADLNPPLGSGGPCLAISRAMGIEPTKLNDLTRSQALQYNDLVELLNNTGKKMESSGLKVYGNPANEIFRGYKTYFTSINSAKGALQMEVNPHVQWRMDARGYSEKLLKGIIESDLKTEEQYRAALYLSLFERNQGAIEEPDDDKRKKVLTQKGVTVSYVPISNAHRFAALINNGTFETMVEPWKRKIQKNPFSPFPPEKTAAAKKRYPEPDSSESYTDDSYKTHSFKQVLVGYRNIDRPNDDQKYVFRKAMEYLEGRGLKLEGIFIKTLVEYGKDDPDIDCEEVRVPEVKVEIVKPKIEESEEP